MYRLRYKLSGCTPANVPLPGFTRDQALQQADAMVLVIYQSGKPGYVKLYEAHQLIVASPILIDQTA